MSPKLTIGGSISPCAMRASGEMFRVNGKAVVLSRSPVLGMQYKEERKKRGDELP